MADHPKDLLRDGDFIDEVLKEAVQEALLQHKRAGNPISEWRDGKVVWIPPEEIDVPDPNDKNHGSE